MIEAECPGFLLPARHLHLTPNKQKARLVVTGGGWSGQKLGVLRQRGLQDGLGVVAGLLQNGEAVTGPQEDPLSGHGYSSPCRSTRRGPSSSLHQAWASSASTGTRRVRSISSTWDPGPFVKSRTAIDESPKCS